MSISIPSINSGVWLGLGKPDASVIEIDEIHYVTRDVVTRLTKQLRNSNQNQVLGVTAEFTPTVSPYDITAILGKNTPAWLEQQVNGRWQTMRVINKVDEASNYARGINSAAFYGDVNGNQYIDFTFDPTTTPATTYRIQYDPDAVPTNLAVADMPVPDSFQPFFELEVQQGCIVKIRRNLSERAENDVERRLLQVRLQTWEDAFAFNEKILIRDWRPLWRTHKFKARTAQSQGRLPSKSGKGLYGG